MVIFVKVIPRAPRDAVRGTMADGNMKIAVRAVPEAGKANDAVCALLARHFGCPRDAVRVLRGTTTTRKVIMIDDSV